TGSRADAEVLQKLQEGDLSMQQINPFYFPEPLAPMVAARKHSRQVPIEEVLNYIRAMQKRFPRSAAASVRSLLLIEGAGGLLAPLGPRYTALEIIGKLRCKVIVVAANRLGTINHTLLTVRALQTPNPNRLTVVLSDHSP